MDGSKFGENFIALAKQSANLHVRNGKIRHKATNPVLTEGHDDAKRPQRRCPERRGHRDRRRGQEASKIKPRNR
jgi:hypothetical protein